MDGESRKGELVVRRKAPMNRAGHDKSVLYDDTVKIGYLFTKA